MESESAVEKTDLCFFVGEASDVGIVERDGTSLDSWPDRKAVQRTKQSSK
jgi:hypothetical protein